MRKFWTGVFQNRKRKVLEQKLLAQVDRTKLPRHLAIIMDGNGRWAQKRGLPRTAGHRYGVEALRKVIEASVELGIPVLTVYAFSTENWKRPKEEVSVLMDLIVEYLQKELDELHQQNIKIRTIGSIKELPFNAREELAKAEKTTAQNSGLKLNVALNYGGRMEILEAARTVARQVETGVLQSSEITEELFSSYLFTAGQPDPDLLIRPSGEYRISNFLLWQLAYAELYFTDIYWPDFSKEEFYRAILDFQGRNRRYGGV
ncbi:MAG: isoprenyl transferase [Bacillota bacterium]|nr:isoprenyl transferase [Clostridia bacterium]